MKGTCNLFTKASKPAQKEFCIPIEFSYPITNHEWEQIRLAIYNRIAESQIIVRTVAYDESTRDHHITFN